MIQHLVSLRAVSPHAVMQFVRVESSAAHLRQIYTERSLSRAWTFKLKLRLAQEIVRHDAPAAVGVLMDAAEAAEDTPFRERVIAHGAVFSSPTDSGCA